MGTHFYLQNWFDRAKLGIEKLVEKVGFFGILAAASVRIKILFKIIKIKASFFRLSDS